MRRRIVFAIVVGSLIFGALNFPAISDVTADLLFVETDGNAIAPVNTVDAAPGDTLRVPVQTSNDEPLTVATIAVPGVGSIALLRTAAVPSLGPGAAWLSSWPCSAWDPSAADDAGPIAGRPRPMLRS